MRADFHLHTNSSDGTLTPAQLLAAVRANRITCFAVTDHDTLAGWRVLRGEPGLIPGVEVTAERDGHEVHIVGLGVDPEHHDFADFLARIRALRRHRLGLLIRSLGEEHRLAVDRLAPAADTLTRQHLAEALIALGRATSMREVFNELIGDATCKALGMPPYPAIDEAVAAIRAAGGVAILAHPGIYGTAAAVGSLLDAGLDGLETAHPRLPGPLAAELRCQAIARGLFESCGSDTHFLGVRQPGEPQLPRERLAPLLARLGVNA